MKKTLLGGIPTSYVLGFLVLLVLSGVFILSRNGAFTQTGLGSCGTLNSLSSQMQYSQVGSLLDTIASAINPSANTYGVFKGTIQFTGPCETVTGTRLNSTDKQANVSTFNINLQQLSCDYNLVPDSSTAIGFGNPQELTYTAVNIPTLGGTGSCGADVALLNPAYFAARFGDVNVPWTFNSASATTSVLIPVSCESQFISSCEVNGYGAYFDSSRRQGISGTSLGYQEPAICAKVRSTTSGTGQILSSGGSAFKPNARVLINYNNQQITLDTANGATGAATSDRNAYFMLNRNTGTFSQNCPTDIALYYKSDTNKNIVNPNYVTTLKTSFSEISSVQGQRNLIQINNKIAAYNNLLATPVIINNYSYTTSGNGQFLSINRLSDPNINPAVDFIIVANQVSVTAQVANPTFVSTNPNSGTCLQTTSVQPTSVSATLTSFTPGNVLVNVNCNTPAGLRTSSQQLTFVGGDTKTANFAITVPANNYSCNFIASNQALGSWNQVAQSSSVCIQSTQAVFEQCSLIGSGSLKTNDPITGRCVCQLTQTQGQNVCSAAGQNYNATSCSCVSATTVSNSCAGQPLSCPNGQVLTRNNVGCNVCSLYSINQTNVTPPATCSYPSVPVTTVQHSIFESIPLIGGAFQPTITTTCTLDPNILIIVGMIIFAIIAISIIYVLGSIMKKGGRRK